VDDPIKDGISIDHLKDFNETLDLHYVAGISNKAFYLLATSPGWDIHKAFDVMLHANLYYWTSSMTTFSEAACGVISAAKDYNYNVEDIKLAFNKVGVETTC
jgi:Zn-dependent metalloprotease